MVLKLIVVPVARKSVWQRFAPPASIGQLMESFRLMCNDVIRIGLSADASSLKHLSKLTYGELKRYEVLGYYKLCAISKAAGILASRRKSIKRGFPTKNPYLSKPLLVSCYGFKVEEGALLVPIGEHRFERIPLNSHTRAIASEPGADVRSFTITERSLSLCISKSVEELPVEGVVGIDRNLRNVTVGNDDQIVYFDVSKTVEIAETTRSIVRSFRRSDVRTGKKIAAKYGQRRQERVKQILNRVSKTIVAEARANG